jgi:hypothetical protein
LIAFVLCVASAVWVLLPHRLVFAFRGSALLAESDHQGLSDVTKAYRAAGIWVEPFLDSNGSKLGDLSLVTLAAGMPVKQEARAT